MTNTGVLAQSCLLTIDIKQSQRLLHKGDTISKGTLRLPRSLQGFPNSNHTSENILLIISRRDGACQTSVECGKQTPR